jgi:DNA-binding response OmpR family regulator
MDTLGGEDLEGILETGPDGRPHFTIPFDSLTAKEAIGLVLYKAQPNPLGDKELILSPKEFSLLAELMRHRGAVLSRDLLLTRVGFRFLR